MTVVRDAHGVPHIQASSMDDLVYAQGYVTAQDRLWQMELLRRHAAGELAAVLGGTLVWTTTGCNGPCNARRGRPRIAVLPADQKHWLEVYARGVNASMVAKRAPAAGVPRVCSTQPIAAWTPRDSLLVELAMFQDLTTGFPEKLGREALTAHLSPELMADLYPVGSWRDHPPGQPTPDLTAPQPEFEDIPLDESQTRLRAPAKLSAPSGASGTLATPVSSKTSGSRQSTPAEDIIALRKTLALFHGPCD